MLIGKFLTPTGGLIVKSLSIALAAAVVSTAALAAAPAMTIGSLTMTLSHEDCMAKAARIIRRNGLTTNFESLAKTVYGERGDYTAAIRCENEHTIAIFVVGGPQSKTTTEYHDKLKADFGAP